MGHCFVDCAKSLNLYGPSQCYWYLSHSEKLGDCWVYRKWLHCGCSYGVQRVILCIVLIYSMLKKTFVYCT